MKKDGSAVLGYGSGLGEPIPAGTYDFLRVVSRITSTLTDKRQSADDFTVALRGPDSPKSIKAK